MEIREYFSILRARKGVVFLALVLFVAAALAADFLRPAEYTAEARLLVSESDVAGSVLGLSPGGGAPSPDRQVQTHAQRIASPGVAAAVAKRLRTAESPADLLADVVVEPIGTSDLVAIRATDTDPARAARVANAFAEEYAARLTAEQKAEFAAVQKQLTAEQKNATARLASARGGSTSEAEIEVATATLARINEQLERLRTAAALPLGGARISEVAEPPADQSGGPFTALLVGAALGLATGVGAAFTSAHFDTRVYCERDVAASGLRVIGKLPAEKSGRGVPALTMFREPSSAAADAYRLVRRSIERASNGSPHVVLVTAPADGTGTGRVAANLAVSVAYAGRRAALVDTDLQRGPLQSLFDLTTGPGLAEVLAGVRNLSEVVQPLVHQRVAVVTAGQTTPNSNELLASSRMRQLVRELATAYDVVFINAPPVLGTADASAFAESVDAIVLVLAVGRVRSEQIQAATGLLGSVTDARIDGLLWGVKGDADDLRGYLPEMPPEEPVITAERLRAQEATSQ